MALGLYDELHAQVRPGSGLSVEVRGEGAYVVPLDASHLVVRSLVRGLSEAGQQLPGLRLRCHNSIPHGRGLGSSSAAIVGGLALARGLLVDGAELLTDERILAIAAQIEGHPDNVAPALLGGLTIAWTDIDEVGRAIRLDTHPSIEPVVAIPKTPLATAGARRLLPVQVPHTHAAANVARVALLTEAMTNQPELLLTATRDWLHQDYRSVVYPQSHALMSELRSQGIPAMISGAGPTVIALGICGSAWARQDVVARMETILASFGTQVAFEFDVRALPVDRGGAAT